MSKFGQYSLPQAQEADDDSVGQLGEKDTSPPMHESNDPAMKTEDSARNGNSSRSKKRASFESDVSMLNDADDILGQICSRMTTLSTKDPLTNKEDSISAFISVLHCSPEEASFFLESSAWNIEAAVHLWLETNNGSGGSGKRLRYGVHANYPFIEREVSIEGLPYGWTAWVDKVTGGIYFVHADSGHSQTAVPPGFADSEWLRRTPDDINKPYKNGQSAIPLGFNQQVSHSGATGDNVTDNSHSLNVTGTSMLDNSTHGLHSATDYPLDPSSASIHSGSQASCASSQALSKSSLPSSLENSNSALNSFERNNGTHSNDDMID